LNFVKSNMHYILPRRDYKSISRTRAIHVTYKSWMQVEMEGVCMLKNRSAE
jgi:hypothetical protein